MQLVEADFLRALKEFPPPVVLKCSIHLMIALRASTSSPYHQLKSGFVFVVDVVSVYHMIPLSIYKPENPKYTNKNLTRSKFCTPIKCDWSALDIVYIDMITNTTNRNCNGLKWKHYLTQYLWNTWDYQIVLFLIYQFLQEQYISKKLRTMLFE